MKPSEAVELVKLLVAAFPSSRATEATAVVYAMGLADIPLDDAQAAVSRLVQAARFLPTIAEIRAEVARARVTLPSPEEAWGIVRRAIGKHGSYRTPIWDCDEIHLAVDAIGWQEICLTEDEYQHTVRSRFCSAFASFATRRIEAETTGTGRRPVPRLMPTGEAGDQRVIVATGYPTWDAGDLDALPAAAAAPTLPTGPEPAAIGADVVARLGERLKLGGRA